MGGNVSWIYWKQVSQCPSTALTTGMVQSAGAHGMLVASEKRWKFPCLKSPKCFTTAAISTYIWTSLSKKGIASQLKATFPTPFTVLLPPGYWMYSSIESQGLHLPFIEIIYSMFAFIVRGTFAMSSTFHHIYVTLYIVCVLPCLVVVCHWMFLHIYFGVTSLVLISRTNTIYIYYIYIYIYMCGYSYCRHWLSLVWLNTWNLTKA